MGGFIRIQRYYGYIIYQRTGISVPVPLHAHTHTHTHTTGTSGRSKHSAEQHKDARPWGQRATATAAVHTAQQLFIITRHVT